MAHRALVIRPGALGDIIQTLPTMQMLSRHGYAGGIELMGSRPVIDWLVGRSVVTSTCAFDRREVAGLFSEEGTLPTPLVDYLSAFDLVLNYAAGPGDALSRNLIKVGCHLLELDVRPAVLPARHISIYLQRPLAALGIQPSREGPHIELEPGDAKAASDWLRERNALGRSLIAVHPGSGSRHKNWPADRFAQVIRSWAGRPNTLVMLIRGPADDSVVAEVSSLTGDLKLIEVDRPTLPLLAALLKQCALYVGNDSGVSHLAGAVGTPSVVLFGPTDPTIWAPQGSSIRVVTSSVECSPCPAERRRGCSHLQCLRSTSVDQVLAEMEGILHDSRAQGDSLAPRVR